jgi:O-acetyl-ADP-ribose deacetylase (regulator of RNase III)
MIEFRTGDIMTADAEALVNTVNCAGVMGRGVALQFKNVFPENFKAYKVACARNEVQPGKMFVYETGNLTNPKFIINFPTKRHWRGKSRMEDIDSGLEALVVEIKERGVKSIAIPPLVQIASAAHRPESNGCPSARATTVAVRTGNGEYSVWA